MSATDNFFSLAVPLGRFMGTRLKLSALMLIAMLAVIWRVQSFTTSLMFGAVLLLSVCLHEMAHIWVSYRTNIRCSERILWPFGGLYSRSPQVTNFAVSVAGPGTCLLLATASGIQLHLQRDDDILKMINPATCWQGLRSDSMSELLLSSVFFINFMIVVVNLIPVRPLASGYVLQSYLSRRYSEIESRDLLLRSGLVFSIFGLLAGFVFDLSGLTALSAFLLLIHVQEAVQWFQPSESTRTYNSYEYRESYSQSALNEDDDFSEDDDEDDSDSVIDRWKNRRESERDVREREMEQREHDELDRVLEKLHQHGRESLSTSELHLLNRVSARLRQKNH